jgi:hypothetical protein
MHFRYRNSWGRVKPACAVLVSNAGLTADLLGALVQSRPFFKEPMVFTENVDTIAPIPQSRMDPRPT